MAGERTVKIKFTGDARGLENATDGASRGLDRVSSASRDAGASFDRAGEAADSVDTRAMGFRDTLTGVQDSMSGVSMIAKGDLFNGLFTLGMGVGDLASGFANFLIPSVKAAATGFISNAVATVRATTATVAHTVTTRAATAATTAYTVVQRALNAVLRANPIGIVITVLAALVAAVVLAYQRSETFRRIVQAAFGAVLAAGRAVGNGVATAMRTVRDAVGGAASWVGGRVDAIVGFFTGMPGRISRAVSGAFNGLGNAFRSAINGIIRGWNRLSFTIGGGSYDPLGQFGPTITVPRFTFNTPNIPTLHSGGVFMPRDGRSEGLALLRRGERVLTPGQGGGEITVNVMLSKEAIAGIAQVEIKKNGRAIKRAITSGAPRVATA
ncbi:hypothetical protein [Jiangella asiatica]|uniref:Phage tail tape measure protein n=1 Tax=Jiangella asiatica TaxID=2530372 RepID=A0A4R5CGR4_9ACTN|nr:hypothetical protein [Jiangella asiatica]TDD98895.1 hypothetical protein E1269_28230 [Jiangella asiatica]